MNDISERFYNGSPCKRCGNLLRYKSNCRCVQCAKLFSGDYRKSYLSVPINRIKALITQATGRAKNKNISYDSKSTLLNFILLSDIHQCSYCRKLLNYGIGNGKSKERDDSPSIDRVDNNYGYVINNIAIICFRCNSNKSNLTINEVRNMLYYMEYNQEKFIKLSA